MLAMKNLFVEANISRVRIDANCKKIVSIFGGGSEPNLPTPDHGRGPAAIGNFGFPFDVLAFAPMKRKADNIRIAGRRDMPITIRPAEFRPIRTRGQSPKE